MDHASGAELLLEVRKILFRGVVRLLRILFGVQVIEVPEELIEAVGGGQVFVEVAKMVLPELAGCVSERFEQLRNRRVLRLETDGRGRNTDLRKPGPVATLPGDERRAASGATLLPVRVGTAHSLCCESIDIGCPVAHQAVAVAT